MRISPNTRNVSCRKSKLPSSNLFALCSHLNHVRHFPANQLPVREADIQTHEDFMYKFLCYENDVCLGDVLANSQEEAEGYFMRRFQVTVPVCPFNVVPAGWDHV